MKPVQSSLWSARRLALLMLSVATLMLDGCARSPVFNVLGSYFPGWIAAIALGIVVAVVVRAVLVRLRWEERIAALPLFYLSLATAAACAFWLLTFE